MEKDKQDPKQLKISPERITWIIRQLIKIDEDEDRDNDTQERERGHSHNEEEK